MTNDTNLNISVTDLAVLRNIIELACERGAFKANEMETVGSTYTKLDSFLKLVIAQAEAAQVTANQQGDVKND